jgi:hypothetical protein
MGFWSELGSSMVNAMAADGMIGQWMDVDDASRLKYVIRNDIRGLNAERIESLFGTLRQKITGEKMRERNSELVARLITIAEILREEADRNINLISASQLRRFIFG